MILARTLAIAAGLGSWIFLHTTWWMGLIIAAGTYLVLKPEEGDPTILQTINLNTGEVKTRGMDRHAQKYLKTLND